MSENTSNNMVIWAVTGVLSLIVVVSGWTITREFVRNDDQEVRLRTVERAVVELSFIRRDVAETKADVKELKERMP